MTDTCAIPVKFTALDMDDPKMAELRALFKKRKRTESDKRDILNLLWQMNNAGSMEYQDPTGKFDFSAYTLKDCRTWKKHSAEEVEARLKERGEPYEADYRFREYDSKHRNKMPYINNKSKIAVLECELLAAYDKYEYEGFVNHRTCIWLSYKPT